MFQNGGCAIHDQPYYPAVCRGFPWLDAEGGRYEYDVSICGELARRPELVELQRALPSAS
jgi:phosphoenolpyruvate-protein kinase (PTS system EI component)